MKRIIDLIASATDKVTKVMVVILVIALVIIITLEVLFRYVLIIPMVWSEQLASYIMIWVAYLSAAIAFRQGAHMGMTILSSRLSEKLNKIVSNITLLMTMVFLMFLTYWGVRHAYDVRMQISPVVFNISMFWPYLAIPVGGLLMLIQNLKVLATGWEIIPDDNTDVLSV